MMDSATVRDLGDDENHDVGAIRLSTEGQEGMGEQGAREADAATGGACMPPGPPTCAKQAADGGSRRVTDRACMSEQASARMARVRAAAETAGMEIGMRLRRVEGDKIFDKWRWGRVPMEGGGWLVTYQHDLRGSGEGWATAV